MNTLVKGRVAVVGAGPGGMATALAAMQGGHDVVLFERHPESRAAGNILNLWPPPLKALAMLGVDIDDLGAPCDTEFHNWTGRRRVRVKLPDEVKKEYGGGFIGLLRPELYERMAAALPPGLLRADHALVAFEQDSRGVRLEFSNGEHYDADVLIGADGIDSVVRRGLWGEAPKREHKLHIIGGYTFDGDAAGAAPGRCVIAHSPTIQGSYTSIRFKGRDGYQWWVLGPWTPGRTFDADLHETARAMARGVAGPLPGLIAATPPENLQRWEIRDRPPLKQWSRGRVTIVGDAAHPTSPYAAYGAGMAIEDGYFLGRVLAGQDLTNPDQVRQAFQTYETPRKHHTRKMTGLAYNSGRAFHHVPAPIRPLRDFIFDHTPLLQKVIGDSNPAEILAQLSAITGPIPAARAADGGGPGGR